MSVQCMYTVYCVLFFPLWLKSEPDWLAISVSTSQQFRVGQIVRFGCLSAISQLASREGEVGGVRQLSLHCVTQPYTTWPSWREQGWGLHSLPLFRPQSTYICRGQSCVWRLPKYWSPTPFSTQRVCLPPAPKGGGTQSPGGEGGGGVNILEDERHRICLLQYNLSKGQIIG